MLRHHAAAEDAVGSMVRRADDLHFANTDDAAAHAVDPQGGRRRRGRGHDASRLDVAGGAGFSRGNVIERCHRDALGARYHPLPAAAQAVFAGRVALGLGPVG